MAERNRIAPWKGVVPPPRRGEKSNLWRGDKVGYSGIHGWLKREYGDPSCCEGEKCKKISNNYQYALIRGMKYERKRGNYMMLCVSCHRIYDNQL